MTKPSSEQDYAAFWATVSTIQETAELLSRFSKALDTGALNSEEARSIYDTDALDNLLFKVLKLSADALDLLNDAKPGAAAQRLFKEQSQNLG